MKDILNLDTMLMIEQHPFVPGLLIYKYNTKFPSVWPMNQKVDASIKISPGFVELNLLTVTQDQSLYVEPMLIAGETIGYLVAARKKDKALTDSDIRLLAHTTPMIATMLREVQHQKNEKEIMLKNQA